MRIRELLARLAVALAACASVAVAQGAAGAGAQAKAVDDYCRRAEAFGFAGSVLVARRGKILLERGYGLADRSAGRRNGPDTLFEIASATKPFTAVAILKLAAQGRLKTSDPISRYLPGVPDDKRDITIHQLLTHTSGMPRSAADGHGADLKTAVAAYLAPARASRPGTRFEYWNGGYALLAGIVEVVTGDSYMEYCRKHLFEPARMTRAGFTGDNALDDDAMAIGYAGDDAVRPAAGHPYGGSYGWHYRGMGGIVASVRDLFKWDRALRRDVVLDAATRKVAFTPMLDGYACGWAVTNTARGTRRIAHGGDVRGFHAHLARFPDEADDAVVIVCCNVDGIPMWSVGSTLESLLFGEQPKYPMPPRTVSLEKEQLKGVTGVYELSPGNRIVVRANAAGTGIVAAAEGQAAMDALLARVRFERSVAGRFSGEVGRAVGIVRALSRGDVGPLREAMDERIPAGWPDTVKSRLWPQHLKRWGACTGVRSLGAMPGGFGGGVSVLVAIDHGAKSSRCKIVFVEGKLQIFDLNGPRALVTSLALPVAPDRFVRFAWIGPAPPALVFRKDTLVLEPRLGEPLTLRRK